MIARADKPVPLHRRYAAGRWYNHENYSHDATQTKSLTVGVIYLLPFVMAEPVGLDRIGASVSIAGGAGSVIRLGIYKDVDGLPLDLVLDAGTIDGTSATTQAITISVQLPRNIYWMGIVAQVGTAPTVYAYTAVGAGNPFLGNTAQPGNQAFMAYWVSGVTGALPATLGAPSPASMNPPIISIRSSG